MTDKEYIDNLTIWCTYHDNKLIDEYNLNYIPSYIKLFNTSDLNMTDNNINYLGPHLCEVCTLYYVWKNQIYSKYVGFCHYRRFYEDLGKYNIEKYGIHYYYCHHLILKIDEEYYFDNIKYLIYEYLYNLNMFDESLLYDAFYNEREIWGCWKISFISTWEIFNKICNIFFGFLEYVLNDFTDKINYIDSWRQWAWFSEFILCIITSLIYKNEKILWDKDIVNNYYSYNLILENNNDLNKILKWSCKNNRACAKITIISDNNDLINKINTDYKEYLFASNSINEKNMCEHNIKLNINEYIKCLDPIEFKNGNYIIEKFDN